MDDLSPGAPNRQQTLESQRNRRKFRGRLARFFARNGATPHEFGPLDEIIEVEAKRYNHGPRFLADFNHISHFPKFPMSKVFDVFVWGAGLTLSRTDGQAIASG